MVIPLQDIPKGGLDLQYEEPAEKFGFPKTSFQGPLSASLHLTREGREVLVEGQILAKEVLPCSRCLKETVHPVQADFQTAYSPMEEIPGEEEVQLRREDLEVIFYRNDEIELLDLIRGQILLVRPIRPLCKIDCGGLCQVCGQDLNENACGCTLEVPDSRFSVLKQLKRR